MRTNVLLDVLLVLCLILSVCLKVVEVKYGSMWGGWCSNPIQGPYGMSLWKTIRKGWNRFTRWVNFRVGDGSYLMFWQDQWCCGTLLRESFP